MHSRHRLDRSIQMKSEISEIEREISHMKVDVEYYQQQGLLIRQLIKEREERINQLIQRVDRVENFHSSRGELDD